MISKRVNHLRCVYWKRDENQPSDNNEFVLNKKPDGVFYAREVANKTNQSEIIGGVFKAYTEQLSIQTEDRISIKTDDVVQIRDTKYQVINAQIVDIHKSNQFSVIGDKRTTISLIKAN